MSEHEEIRKLCERGWGGSAAMLAHQILEILDRTDTGAQEALAQVAGQYPDERCCCRIHAPDSSSLGCLLCVVHAPATRGQRSAICPACGYHRGTIRPYCPTCNPSSPPPPTLRE